jgi:hypothetical protein
MRDYKIQQKVVSFTHLCGFMKLLSAAPVSKSSRFRIRNPDVLMALPPAVDFLATCLARTIVGAEKGCFSTAVT